MKSILGQIKSRRQEVALPVIIMLTLIGFASSPLFGQMDLPGEMSGAGDPTLRTLKVGSVISMLYTFGGVSWEAWSSSYLKAEGTSPAKPKLTGDKDKDEELNYDYTWALDKWSSMYTAHSLTDHDAATCWVEGEAGPGINEVVIAKVDAKKPVYIRNGFQKNQTVYNKNARPHLVRVFLLQADRQVATQFDLAYSDIKVLAASETELTDTMGWQQLKLPVYKLTERKAQNEDDYGVSNQTFIALQILSVYPGSAYQDTCISDIANDKD